MTDFGNEKPGDWAVTDGWGRHIAVAGHTEEAARRYTAENSEDDCTLIRLSADGQTWYPAEGLYARPDLMPETGDEHRWSISDIVEHDGRERLVRGFNAHNRTLVLEGVDEDVPFGDVRLVHAAVEDIAGPAGTEPAQGTGATTNPDGGTGGPRPHSVEMVDGPTYDDIACQLDEVQVTNHTVGGVWRAACRHGEWDGFDPGRALQHAVSWHANPPTRAPVSLVAELKGGDASC